MSEGEWAWGVEQSGWFGRWIAYVSVSSIGLYVRDR
jgi:hypothetical protein